DPWKLSPRQLILPLPGLMIAALLDGTRTLAEVQAEFVRRHGVEVPLTKVQELRDALDEALLLEGPHLDRALAEFKAAPVRPAACVPSYSDERGAAEFLEAQWRRPGG